MTIDNSFWKKYAEHHISFKEGDKKSESVLEVMNKELRKNKILNPFEGWRIRGVEFYDSLPFFWERFSKKSYAIKLAKELNIPLKDVFYFGNFEKEDIRFY